MTYDEALKKAKEIPADSIYDCYASLLISVGMIHNAVSRYEEPPKEGDTVMDIIAAIDRLGESRRKSRNLTWELESAFRERNDEIAEIAAALKKLLNWA